MNVEGIARIEVRKAIGVRRCANAPSQQERDQDKEDSETKKRDHGAKHTESGNTARTKKRGSAKSPANRTSIGQPTATPSAMILAKERRHSRRRWP